MTIDFELAMIQMLLRSACGFIMLSYVFLKFLRVKLFLSGHELANSFLLFRVHKCFLQMIKNISWRHAQFTFLMLILMLLLFSVCEMGCCFIYAN